MCCHLFKMQTQMQSGQKLPTCNAAAMLSGDVKWGTFNIPPGRVAILQQYSKERGASRSTSSTEPVPT